jgi:dienelactone hydrolase
MKSPAPMKFDFKATDSFLFEDREDTPTTGPRKVTIEVDPTLPKFTVYRPEFAEAPLPIVAWANGGCLKDGVFFGDFLNEIASWGYLIVADGVPNGQETGGGVMADPVPQTMAMDWAVAENERPCSQYYHKLDVTKIAVMGQSCGGVMSLAAGTDPRVTTTVLWNSGLFERDDSIYSKLHSPIAIIDGGPDDVAYENGAKDFEAINHVPIMFANHQSGHGGGYWKDNGGDSAIVGTAWLNWHLKGDTGMNGKGMFLGAGCGLCGDKPAWSPSKWDLKFKMLQ